MKRFISGILSILMVCSLCACSSASPTEVADDFLQSIKSADEEELKKVYMDSSDFEKYFAENMDDESNKLVKELGATLQEKLLDFDYELGKEEIKDDKATVEVKITTYNFAKVVEDLYYSYFEKAMKMSIAGTKDDEIEQELLKDIKGGIDKVKKTYEGNVKLSLTKKNGKWVIDEIKETDEFFNAFTGGAIKEMDLLGDVIAE